MTHENFCYWLKGYTSNPNKNWQEVEKQLKVLFPDCSVNYSDNYTGSLKLGSITGNLTSDGNITYTSSTGADTLTMLSNADYGRYVLAHQ